MQSALTKSNKLGKLLQVGLVAVCMLSFSACKQLVDDGQSAQEKLDCFNKCNSVCTTDSCRYNCSSTCGCTYTSGNTGGFVQCKGD